MSGVETLKEKMEKAQESVKRQKAAYKAHKGTEKEKLRKRILRASETKFQNAKRAYQGKCKTSGSSIKDRFSNTKQNVMNTGKKAFTWTGLAIVTVVTGIGGFLVYDHFKSNEEKETTTDTV
ncbi:MAG: hypothetical protein K9L62_10410 [Vallitaleaceae bacterium]|nr:hypothetical protein [Vallitaleaceae bacterium]